MKILFTGGGTMGPVTPLLAVMRAMKKRREGLEFVWAGTPDGPERPIVQKEGVKFYPITVAKLPRYLSKELLMWPIKYLQARWESDKVIRLETPALVASVGGFTSVPIIRAAARQKIPCAIHQLDAEPGLSNKVIATKCQSVTTTFGYDLPAFPGVIAERVPTPSRFAGSILPSRWLAASMFGFDPAKPILFVTGGGTGATALNEAIWNQLGALLPTVQIIHLTGIGKGNGIKPRSGYFVAEFFDEQKMLNALTAADLVVSRAGIGSIADLACLSKPVVFVPIPNSHQERNVKKIPCAVVQQTENFAVRLSQTIQRLMRDKDGLAKLGAQLHASMPTDDGSALAVKWLKLIKA